MKKILSLVIIVLTMASTLKADDMSDARRREQEAVNGQARSAYLVPGYPGYPGYRPPGPPPGYSDIYGPPYTVRWQDMGTHRSEKFAETSIYISASGQFVNEVLLTSIDNRVEIRSAQARLANGQMISLNQLAVTLRKGQQFRLRLDSYYSLRIDQIILTAISPNLIGSRGQLNVQLGVAY